MRPIPYGTKVTRKVLTHLSSFKCGIIDVLSKQLILPNKYFLAHRKKNMDHWEYILNISPHYS
jgi:hypothetical protein